MSSLLKTCLEVCTYLKSLIKKSFGPNGQTSLILTTTGHVTITNCGITILEAANCSHPVAGIILKALFSHCKSAGDGSKTFILLTERLLNEILMWAKKNNNMKTEMVQSYLAMEFYQLLHLVLPKCFSMLRTRSYCHCTVLDSSNLKNVELDCFVLLKSFFCGKFSSLVSKQLTVLCKNFIFYSQNDWNNLPTAIKEILQNFGILCTCIDAVSLKESKVIKGILIHRSFTVRPSDCNAVQKFIIIRNNKLNDNVTNSAVFDIADASQLSKILNWDFKECEKIIDYLKKLKITTILCASGLPDIMVSLCKQNNIGLITMISNEEIEFLASVTNVKILNNFEETVSKENIGSFNSAVSLLLGNQVYVHVSMDTYHTSIMPHHLILCGPTAELSKQYLQSCQDSIKVIALWLKQDDAKYNFKTEVDYTPNNFRKQLSTSENYKLINKRYSNDCITSQESISEDCVQTFHESKDFKNEDMHSEHIITSAYPTGGFWELCLQAELKTATQLGSCSQARCILGNSLLVVAESLHENSYSGKSNFISLLTQIQKGIMSDNVKLLDGHKGTVDSVNKSSFEPVTLKEMIVFHVVQLIIQLLRLDKVVSSNKLHSNQSEL